MRDDEKQHVQAQIERLYADAKRHTAIAKELQAQGERMQADLKEAK